MKIKNENRKRALKAWNTMRERGFWKYSDRSKEEMYNNPKKNKVRGKIINLIKKHGGKNILTLETHNFMLALSLKKHSFFIAENDYEEYLKMIENKPQNVFLHFGEVFQMASLLKDFDVVYLDFCCGYNVATKTITKLRDKIDNANLVGFTFCLRNNKKDYLEDYTLDLIFKLQEFLGNDFRPIYKTSYADTTAMATVFFINVKNQAKKQKKTEEEKDKEEKKRERKNEMDWKNEYSERKRLVKYTIKKIQKHYPHIWTPHQIFDSSAKTNFIKTSYGDLIVKRLFNLAIKDGVFRFIGGRCEDYNYRFRKNYDELDYAAFYEYFLQVLFRGIFNLWRKNDKHWRCWDARDSQFLADGYDLFLVNKNKKRNDCYLCGDKKGGIFEYKCKNFCTTCFLNYISGNGFSGVKEPELRKLVSRKDEYDIRLGRDFYYGSKNCVSCKKKICEPFTDLKEMIFKINGNCFCEECYNKNILPKLNEVKKLREDYSEILSKKIMKTYGLKLKKEENK